jgi:hypothetical protein
MFRWIRRMRQETRVLAALIDYPQYGPPEWDPETKSPEDANAEYREFFLDNRDRRVDALRIFLSKFDVSLDFSDFGVAAISDWCPVYADLLVEELGNDTVWSAYHGFAAPWKGPLLGLNPIFDLGVYYGECLLVRNSKLTWQPLRGPEPGTAAHPIFSQRNRRPFDPINWMYTWCKNIRSAKMARFGPGSEFLDKTALSRDIQAQATM